MTAYYSTLKPGGYGAILKPPQAPTAPTVPQPQPTAQTPNVGGWQAPTVPTTTTPKPTTGYGAILPGAPTQNPPTVQGHPTTNPAASASAAATKAGQAQEMAQGQAMATASNAATDPYANLDPATAARYRQQAAAAAGAGRAAQNASQAATTAGQNQEVAQNTAMAAASKAAEPSYTPPPTFSTTLQKQSPLTEAGGLYDSYVTDVLKGDRAIAGVDSARSDSERRNALNYSHTMQQAQEAAAQAGMQPGTAGYNRIIQEAMAGISSQNLDRTNSVNQLQRQGYQDILGLGRGIEDTAYGRATDERGYQTGRADTEYNRGINERTYTDERGDVAYNRTKTNDLQAKTEKLAAINAIEDPKARQAAMNAYLAEQGGQGTYGAILGMYNADGSLKTEYQSQNPAQGDYQQRIAELKAYYPGKTDAEIQAMAVAEREQERTVSRAPVDKATTEAEQAKITEKLRLGQQLTPEEKTSAIANGTIPEFTAANLPVNDADPAFKELVGKQVNIGGQLYTVVKSIAPRTGYGDTTAQARHTDVAVVTDEAGKTKYIWGGNISDTPPKEVAAPHYTPWGF